ncbi:hypothetical protein TcWFU_005814 [Taenia crassiceps]|uniref:Uncharacterized protein n=1 Tax=Taenia crassiceps TaxID=6207 RepID=A0ABR4Q3K0_9CEST
MHTDTLTLFKHDHHLVLPLPTSPDHIAAHCPNPYRKTFLRSLPSYERKTFRPGRSVTADKLPVERPRRPTTPREHRGPPNPAQSPALSLSSTLRSPQSPSHTVEHPAPTTAHSSSWR